MDSDTDSASKKEQDEQVGDSKKQSKKKSKSKQKKAGKGKAKAAKKPKEKQKKQDKEPKKKKASKSKDKGANFQKDLQTVKQYMQKQNRPYNLLNIFDNLHGSIKKPALQAVLDKLAAMEVLTCKEFGKNKVYFLNQSRFEINEEIIDKLTADLTVAREQNSQLQIKHKALTDEYKKLMSMMTETQLQNEIEKTKIQLEKLEIKKQKLTSGAGSKIDEATVIKAEKQQQKLRRQLKKFRGIKKDALNTWSEILEKKPAEVAEIMGLD